MLLYIDNNQCVSLSSNLDGVVTITINILNNSKTITITIINNIRY